jgi:hypothetical protein
MLYEVKEYLCLSFLNQTFENLLKLQCNFPHNENFVLFIWTRIMKLGAAWVNLKKMR